MINKEKIKSEAAQVKELGERIGYGHLMSMASALWRKSLEDKGWPVIGAFIPMVEEFVEKDMLESSMKEREAYDAFVRF